MKSSCIAHPPNETLFIVREWQMAFCEGNECAAKLMSFFEYWHNIKLDMREKNKQANDTAEKHGDKRTQDEELVQFHTCEQLRNGMLNTYQEGAITKALNYLQEKGVISIFKNPNPRYHFDKTRHFIFNPDVANSFLRSREKPNGVLEKPKRVLEKRGAIPETTSEITTETTSLLEERKIFSIEKQESPTLDTREKSESKGAKQDGDLPDTYRPIAEEYREKGLKDNDIKQALFILEQKGSDITRPVSYFREILAGRLRDVQREEKENQERTLARKADIERDRQKRAEMTLERDKALSKGLSLSSMFEQRLEAKNLGIAGRFFSK